MKILFVVSWLPNHEKKRSGIFNMERILTLHKQSVDLKVIYLNNIMPEIRYMFPFPHFKKIFKTFKDRFNLILDKKLADIDIVEIKEIQYPKPFRKYKLICEESWLLTQIKHKLIRIINSYQPDAIVISRIYPEGSMFAKLMPHINCPVICIGEGSEILVDAKSISGWKNSEKMINQAGVNVVCVSDNMYKIVNETTSIKKTHLLKNGFNCNIFSFQAPCEDKNVFQIIFVGRLAPVKAVDVLIKACALLDFPYHLQIIGGGCEGEKLAQMVIHMDLSEHITFLGDIDHDKLPAYLATAHLFCLPSHSESFGISALEAMACGLPVVGSAVGGLIDLIIDEFNGLKSIAGNANSLADNIKRARQISWDNEKIASWAKANYSWDTWATNLQKLINKVQ